jgi:hypothetical protein
MRGPQRGVREPDAPGPILVAEAVEIHRGWVRKESGLADHVRDLPDAASLRSELQLVDLTAPGIEHPIRGDADLRLRWLRRRHDRDSNGDLAAAGR